MFLRFSLRILLGLVVLICFLALMYGSALVGH